MSQILLDSVIFRAYDIRGVYGVQLNAAGYAVLGRAVGAYLGGGKVLLTGDGRTHTPELARALAGGLLTNPDIELVWGGSVPTPATLCALHEGEFRASLQITASHNGPEYNGLKLGTRLGSICGEELQEIYRLITTETVPEAADLDELDQLNVAQVYLDAITKTAPHPGAAHVVVDAGNGIAGALYPDVFRAMGLTVSELFCEVDGRFPNHQPDPEEEENLQDAQRVVAEKKADFGLVFDGDGDRVGIVTRSGNILTADHILYVLAADFLARNPGESVVLDIMCSSALATQIEQLGGHVIWSPTGHSHIERTMHARQSQLGGEQSGHFMFGEDFYGHDDALWASVRFLSAVGERPELLTQITETWPKLHEYKEKKTVSEAQKFQIIERLQLHLAGQFPDAIVIDGARINWPDGSWGIVRASNTSPKISMRVQAPDAQILAERVAVFQQAITHAIDHNDGCGC